jgi:hypothetical protein
MKNRLPALLAVTAIAALAWGVAAPASAALVDNGIEINGFQLNALADNGTRVNGAVPAGSEAGFDFGAIAVLGLE